MVIGLITPRQMKPFRSWKRRQVDRGSWSQVSDTFSRNNQLILEHITIGLVYVFHIVNSEITSHEKVKVTVAVEVNPLRIVYTCRKIWNKAFFKSVISFIVVHDTGLTRKEYVKISIMIIVCGINGHFANGEVIFYHAELNYP